ncbi:MAG: hypothetical protein ACYS8Z_25710, partial [Planctomycetota bacterium]
MIRNDSLSPVSREPFPNGGIINVGAYGGTVEASKSYFGASPESVSKLGAGWSDLTSNLLYGLCSLKGEWKNGKHTTTTIDHSPHISASNWLSRSRGENHLRR